MAEFERVAELNEIENLQRKSIILNDEISALLFRVDESYYCVEDICSHDGQPLADGPLDGLEVTCTRHGAKFDITTGAATKMPARRPIRVFEVEVRKDGIYVLGED